tara:strand:- start:357 stop:842 length:486 start_codon:yes stop_codon:yes gene_type:complete
MTKLPLEIKRLIKRKKFSCNTSDDSCSWRGGLKIDYRITHVAAEDEGYYPKKSPLNPGYSPINVNITVKGLVEVRDGFNNEKVWRDIVKVAKHTRIGGDVDGWGCYYSTTYNYLWGDQPHKRVRNEIRSKVKEDIHQYLKLLGIQSEYYEKIQVKKITWEK